jgi:rod shape determining protein RodA
VTALRHRVRHDTDPWWYVVDPLMILAAGGITVIGALLVYSATRGPATELIAADRSFLEKQAFFAIVGLALGAVTAMVDVARIRQFTPLAYVGLIVLLVGVLGFGREVDGAQAWFQLGGFTFQPSEPGKVVLILVMAGIFSHDLIDTRRLALGLLVAGVPIGLILLQPDLGTVLVYLAIVAAIVMLSTVKARVLGLLVILAITGVVGIFQSDVLASYQEARLTVFVLDDAAIAEDDDLSRYAYNAKQSEIAIGNGGLSGKGLFEGSQTRSDFVPAQETDFIFSVAGEELGFRGAGLLLALFGVVVFRVWRTAARANDEFDRMVCIGVMAMFLFQIFQSVGMTMGMMPVTGIPLPLVSYGGSSMITSFIALGLVLNVHRRRFDYARR